MHDLASLKNAAGRLEAEGQGHVLRYWTDLGPEERDGLLDQIRGIDFDLLRRLGDTWLRNTPGPDSFESIEAAHALAPFDAANPAAREALEAGEEALRTGRVGLVLVAGGQGTRLGFSGPKGTFPIAPVSKRSLFHFHAEKIHNLQRRYGCELPWYIMVGASNETATVEFFVRHDYFGLDRANIFFFKQRMMPSVDEDGKLILESKARLAMNPNGHGGCIPALSECGVIADARNRGIDLLSYFQVDNWAVRVADPYFIGHHVLSGGEMSSKIHRKKTARESVGVFCQCDGALRVIEYTELDIYPRLLDTNEDGSLVHYAANAAVHVFSVDFVERVFERFEDFPWHCSHKRIPFVDEQGVLQTPSAPNGYKFETFVFDALRFSETAGVLVEMDEPGEFAPTKQMTGPGGVEEARIAMGQYWAEWLEAAGCPVARDDEGHLTIAIEISPQFAFSKAEFLERTHGRSWEPEGDIAIDQNGDML